MANRWLISRLTVAGLVSARKRPDHAILRHYEAGQGGEGDEAAGTVDASGRCWAALCSTRSGSRPFVPPGHHSGAEFSLCILF
ncbi:Mechanosensitive ion channel [Granulibacter bethesdensis CGDNIH1]|uniref:Mechanosensitive ion channel n=1 Tax=Granulibacter bethesdensis (strain ATCC BAA-1260 / CGDNIH1) TaxID=391165 RepID=A0A286M315_GRABC|nr:Mechanosensitive ion channel [Granulibacter bethesdensis]ASV62414.1 Mechanosensitive ion channel [Granulibacter bethesdensis CGDNIH1]